jgi:hypothetical protein
MFHDSLSHRVFFDVRLTSFELFVCAYLALVLAPFPYVELTFQEKRETALDVLNGLLQGDVLSRSKNQMNVVWHDNERVKLKPAKAAIALEHVKHQFRVGVNLEDAPPSGRDGSQKISAKFLRRIVHRSQHIRRARG